MSAALDMVGIASCEGLFTASTVARHCGITDVIVRRIWASEIEIPEEYELPKVLDGHQGQRQGGRRDAER